MRRLVPSFVAIFSLCAAAEPLQAPALSPDEATRLDKGEVLTRSITPTGNKGVGAVALGLIDAPTTEVWPVVRDCQHFKHFMPRTKDSSVKQHPEKGSMCHVELDMPFPLTNLWSDTTSVVRQEGGAYLRAWTLVEGTYHRNDGSWTLLPWGEGGAKTLLVYTIDSNPKLIVPDGLMRSAQLGSLPEVVKQVRKRVVDLRAGAAAKAGGTAPAVP